MRHSPTVIDRSAIYSAGAWVVTVELAIVLTLVGWPHHLDEVLLGWVVVCVGSSCIITVRHLLARTATQILDDIALMGDAQGQPPPPASEERPPQEGGGRFSVVDRG